MPAATLNDDEQPQRPRRGHQDYCAPSCLGLNGIHRGEVFVLPAEDGPVKVWLQGAGHDEPRLLLSIDDDQPGSLALDEAERAGEVLAQLLDLARSGDRAGALN